MTTTAQLIATTRDYLYAGSVDQQNTLAAGYTAGGTSLSFSYDLGGIQAGSLLSVGLETLYVQSVNSSSKTATVIGAQGGSTATDHASGSQVLVNPRFSDFSILQAVNADLDDLSSPANGLFQVKTVDLTANPAVTGYDLGVSAASFLDILEVKWKEVGPAHIYPTISQRKWRVKLNSNTATFASGVELAIYEPMFAGANVRVSYSAPFTHVSSLTDDVATVSGLPTTALDIPALGSAARLVSVKEVRRDQIEVQGDTRRSNEVPPGALIGAARQLSVLRQTRIAAEAARLQSQYPTRIH